MAQKKNRRKVYFIMKKLQFKFIFRFYAVAVLGAILTGVLLYIFSMDTVTTAFVNSRLSIVRTSNYILPTLINSSLISLVLVSIVTIVVFMYFSHRVVGPLYKIEKCAKEIGKGNLGLIIKLRSTDEIKSVADSLNNMTGDIRDHVGKMKDKIVDVSENIDKLNKMLKDDDSLPAEALDALKELRTKKEQLDKAASYFKVS